MSNLRKKLGMAACTLVAATGQSHAQSSASTDDAWEVDTSYLSYLESDGRVSVSKTLANLTRQRENGTLNISLVHDTMSGASPTGAIRSDDSAVTYTSASGGGGFSAGGGGDYSLSFFDDTRVQVGVGLEQEQKRGLTLSYGGAISKESDYDSIGINVGAAKESANRLTTLNAGLAFTLDTISRSGAEGTPEPLGDTTQERPFSVGKRNTVDGILGVSRVLNKNTVAQVNVGAGLSQGYHSDPYKIISAADDEDRILANFHDSRPHSRLRTSLFGKIVHQLNGSKNSIHLSYRLYQDDWGIRSHTGDLRYHYKLTKRQYLEPHLRAYHQTNADFYQRSLSVNESVQPVLPENGLASSDYRLDSMTSTTVGMKYGFSFNPATELRVRAEYISQAFRTADYGTNNALVLNTSLKFRF